MLCRLCPRACGVDRSQSRGFCGAGTAIRAARASLHFGEEPCISGTRGSGTVFFSHCTLGCVFCQNSDISAGGLGWEIGEQALSQRLLCLQREGAHNVNLVSPTPYLPALRRVLAGAQGLHLPVISNNGGYESRDTLEEYGGLFNIFMPDLKFCDSTLSARYLHAADYFSVATSAILTMRRMAGPPVLDGEGMLRSGLLLRHLVMPGAKADSLRIVDWICANLSPDDLIISLMSQYLPLGRASEYPEIDRRITTYEYACVEDALRSRGYHNLYTQSRQSATAEYLPRWDGEGIR